MTSREEWLAGARPKTLAAGIAPVIVGTAFAGYNANAVNFILALVVGVGLQVGVNYANDYSDGIKGSDSDRVGPVRLVGSGAATPEAVRRAALTAISIAALAGLLLSARSSWILLALGALSIIAAWTYTGGPKPYGYFALGEVSVFLFFGLIATLGTYFAHVGSLSFDVALASFAMGSLACAILVLNNLRDLASDKAVGKITLAVKIGDARTRQFFQGLIFAPFLIALALLPISFYFLLAFLALPQSMKVASAIRSGVGGSGLIELLERTGKIRSSMPSQYP